MANEPSWDELFNPQPKASEPAQPAPAAPDPAVSDAPREPATETDPFAALFAGFETDSTPIQPPAPAETPVAPADAPVASVFPSQYVQPEPQQAFPPQPTQTNPPAYPEQVATPSYQEPIAPPTYQEPVAPPTYQEPAAPPTYQQQPQQQPPAQAQPTVQAQPAVQQQPFPPDWPLQQVSEPEATIPAQPVVQQEPAPPAHNADPFADIFASQPGAVQATPVAAASDSVPLTRRELREREAQGGGADVVREPMASAAAAVPAAAAAAVPAAQPVAAPAAAGFPFDFGGGGDRGNGGNGSNGSGGGYYPPEKPRKRRSMLWLKITLPIVLVLAALGGGAAYAWTNYEDQVRELMGWQLPNDFSGTGNGVEVIVTIQSGEIGSDVASTLHDKGVTMTFDAFYDLLLSMPDNVNFLPGNYSLQEKMSAQSALDALLDPANKVTSKLLLTEGTTLPSALEIMAETTGIPLEEFQAAAADYTQFGVPAQAPSLEGYLFPATYELDGTETAVGLLQLLVDTMFQHLDDAGVPVAQRHEILTKASIIQREAGSNQDDFYKIARVFQNRLDQGINLQSDATVAYGTGNLHTVWTTDDERADAGNLYNTYANAGLPVGPIGLPGDLAIDAALHPADGPWLFFVPINLATGETVFSETADEHEAAVQVLRDWCDASPENASYCE